MITYLSQVLFFCWVMQLLIICFLEYVPTCFRWTWKEAMTCLLAKCAFQQIFFTPVLPVSHSSYAIIGYTGKQCETIYRTGWKRWARRLSLGRSASHAMEWARHRLVPQVSSGFSPVSFFLSTSAQKRGLKLFLKKFDLFCIDLLLSKKWFQIFTSGM